MLCGISTPFGVLSPSQRQVTHTLLTRPPLSIPKIRRSLIPEFPARLACVRHAASVRPEPGSNSLKKIFKARRLYVFKKIVDSFKRLTFLLKV